MSLKMKGTSIVTTVCFVHGLAGREGKVFTDVTLKQICFRGPLLPCKRHVPYAVY